MALVIDAWTDPPSYFTPYVPSAFAATTKPTSSKVDHSGWIKIKKVRGSWKHLNSSFFYSGISLKLGFRHRFLWSKRSVNDTNIHKRESQITKGWGIWYLTCPYSTLIEVHDRWWSHSHDELCRCYHRSIVRQHQLGDARILGLRLILESPQITDLTSGGDVLKASCFKQPNKSTVVEQCDELPRNIFMHLTIVVPDLQMTKFKNLKSSRYPE